MRRPYPGVAYPKHEKECERQMHVHEFLGSTKLAEEAEDRHNHRFAGVSCEAEPCGDSHFHWIITRTDFVDHFHEIKVRSGPARIVNPGQQPLKHVHFVKGMTSVNDEHCHEFVFATLIEAPIFPLE